MVVEVAIISVWPSGSAVATMRAPIVPPWPGLFSTTTAPIETDSFCATSRAITSTGPPAPNGTIILIGLVGKAWAVAEGETGDSNIKNRIAPTAMLTISTASRRTNGGRARHISVIPLQSSFSSLSGAGRPSIPPARRSFS